MSNIDELLLAVGALSSNGAEVRILYKTYKKHLPFEACVYLSGCYWAASEDAGTAEEAVRTAVERAIERGRHL